MKTTKIMMGRTRCKIKENMSNTPKGGAFRTSNNKGGKIGGKK